MKQHERLVRELRQYGLASVIVWDRNMQRPITTITAAKRDLLAAAAELDLVVDIQKVEYKTCEALMAKVRKPAKVEG